MSNRWPGCVKIHEGCGGLVRWREAVETPGVGYHGECITCHRAQLAVEDIIPIELPDGTKAAHQHEFWDEQDQDVLADLSWDDDLGFDANQAAFTEALADV